MDQLEGCIMLPNYKPKTLSKQQEQNAINDWLLSQIQDNPTAVFLTLKFRHKQIASKDYENISLEQAEKLLRVFLRKMDIHYHGYAAATKRHAGVPRLVFKHMGVFGENVHYHIVALPNDDPHAFVKMAEQKWASLDTNGWIDCNKSWFEVVGSDYKELKDATLYAAREVHKIGAEDSWQIHHTISRTPSIEKTP